MSRKKIVRKVTPDRAWALDAAAALNDIEGDLMMGRLALARVRVESPQFDATPQAIRLQERMCIFHMVLACTKLCEFYDKFRPVLTPQESDLIRSAVKEIRERGAVRFRNTVVGHIWDDKEDRLVTPSLIDAGIRKLTKGDEAQTLEWLHPLGPTAAPSVYGAARAMRESLCARFGITAKEVLSR